MKCLVSMVIYKLLTGKRGTHASQQKFWVKRILSVRKFKLLLKYFVSVRQMCTFWFPAHPAQPQARQLVLLFFHNQGKWLLVNMNEAFRVLRDRDLKNMHICLFLDNSQKSHPWNIYSYFKHNFFPRESYMIVHTQAVQAGV